MARLRRSRFLNCFYCGKVSDKPNDGSTRKFECKYCDATNFLDENGEITDPPVATDREQPAVQYNTNRPSSPVSSDAPNDIFCGTCLKNQRLFTASLAQYLPEDPSDPNYEQLDRDYYKFRRGLEKRYPQVCGDCADEVERRIQAAGYTAKTDHIRRMMARTRDRPAERRASGLNWIERLGRGLWWAGLVMQMLWHVKMLCAVAPGFQTQKGGMVDPDESENLARILRLLRNLMAALPDQRLLIKTSITAAILSSWWNPRFVQFSRGFTRHILGIRQWYSFQGLIIFFRVVFQRLARLETSRGPGIQILPHLVMAALMTLIYAVAQRSIRVDTTPLFGSPSTPSRSPAAAKSSRPALEEKVEDRQSLSSILDEVLASPSKTENSQHASVRPLPSSYPPPMPFRSSASPRVGSPSQTTLGAPEGLPQAADPDEMDWTPTQSQHRAFQPAVTNAPPGRPFSQAPIQPESGAFWYKVPAAPTNSSQKLRSPPSVPIVRKQQPEATGLGFGVRSSSNKRLGVEDQRHGVEFQRPKFFAPTRDDERSSLADMLDKSFTLGSDGDALPSSQAQQDSVRDPGPRNETSSVAYLETLLHALLLFLWFGSLPLPAAQSGLAQVSIVSVAGVLSVASMGSTTQLMASRSTPSVVLLLLPISEVVELAGLCWLGWTTWVGERETFSHGAGILGIGLARQVLCTFFRPRAQAQDRPV